MSLEGFFPPRQRHRIHGCHPPKTTLQDEDTRARDYTHPVQFVVSLVVRHREKPLKLVKDFAVEAQFLEVVDVVFALDLSGAPTQSCP